MSSKEADVLGNLIGKLMEKNQEGYQLQGDQMNKLHTVELLRDYTLRKLKDLSVKRGQLAKRIFCGRDMENQGHSLSTFHFFR